MKRSCLFDHTLGVIKLVLLHVHSQALIPEPFGPITAVNRWKGPTI